MSNKDSFASLMGAGPAQNRQSKRFKPGEVVKGTVIQIGHDTVFVDVGGEMDAQIERGELVDRAGKLQVTVGDEITATVVSHGEQGPRLARSFGRGNADLSQLQQAKESGLPVEGKVVKATNGGLELTLGGVRAFCPASQIDLNYVQDLEQYVGQTLEFRVQEIKEGGRSIVASRKALLQAQADVDRTATLSRLSIGEVLEGTVVSIQKFGAFVDLGGIQGLVHISELAHHRIDRVEDVLEVGERVQVQVQKLERGEKGQPRIELSMKALLKQEERPAPAKDAVLEATVTKCLPNGILIETAQGGGLVPVRELGIPRGADHRRAFPVGTTLRVVALGKDPSGRLSFSVAKVGAAEERQNFASYGKGETAAAQGSLGSLGDVLRAKLGLPAPAPEPVGAISGSPLPASAPEAQVVAKSPGALSRPQVVAKSPTARDTTPMTVRSPGALPAASAPTPASRAYVDDTPRPKQSPKGLPAGVVKRRRDPPR